MATPGVAGQGGEIQHEAPPERIQVDIPGQLQEVRVLLHHDGLVPVLDGMAVPLVPAAEGPGVPGEQRAQGGRQGPPAGPDQEMGMIR